MTWLLTARSADESGEILITLSAFTKVRGLERQSWFFAEGDEIAIQMAASQFTALAASES